ncbi:hypothetical protein ABEB36_004853 [Hypothenemus hampei]|uniref:WASH complex subunit 3 n=1 Tax=Hypothenemus hampei TaxID=57062 RepID=A0ABD1EWN4_HYPHA
MQKDDFIAVESNGHYSQIPSLQQKRIIAFINHFVSTTVSYLNDFSLSCESRFMDFEYKLQRIEASLLILEAQLSSIPNFEEPLANSTINTGDIPVSAPTNDVEFSEINKEPENDTEHTQSIGIKASEDPRFTKFFKMLRFGVKEEAVKYKMQSAGLNPNILNNPDAVIPE